jgi:hypothetical protein
LFGACHISRPLASATVGCWIQPLPRLSGAHWIVRCPGRFWPSDYFWSGGSRPLALYGDVDCWPWAHQTVQCTPDSSMNFSRRALSFSREWHVRWARQPVHQTLSGAHWTVRCTAGWFKSDSPHNYRNGPRVHFPYRCI